MNKLSLQLYATPCPWVTDCRHLSVLLWSFSVKCGVLKLSSSFDWILLIYLFIYFLNFWTSTFATSKVNMNLYLLRNNDASVYTWPSNLCADPCSGPRHVGACPNPTRRLKCWVSCEKTDSEAGRLGFRVLLGEVTYYNWLSIRSIYCITFIDLLLQLLLPF